MEKLNKINGVSFEPMEHRYFYNDVELKGITEIIKNYFFPNMYSAVPEDFLREKADYGSKVHSEIDAIISGFLDEPSTPEAKEFGENLLVPNAKEYIIDDAELERVYREYPCRLKEHL